ncbi:BAG family molecular chaperone regulator 4 [Apostasia shenzhenica]|uniref:BAG family molecular chaperone regulator 4 n=1 Tax=Apostasia shenzhenica TaxID=1088818 RepID=A0A2I0A8N3_9ASPA|nr:BAG family molecular chaperone regulator 4 [Apostasia shenzhenica]
MNGSTLEPPAAETGCVEVVDREIKPGGLPAPKCDDRAGSAGPMIKIKVLHDCSQHELTVPAQSTFGELKGVLTQETGLEPQDQRLLFRGKEKEDDECLHRVGVKDMSKVVLLENPVSRERKLEKMTRDEENAKACEAIASVKAEVDKLVEKVNTLVSDVRGGKEVADQEFVVLTELLMRQLLKLDSIVAEGDAKMQRKNEVRRAQQYVEMLDSLKPKNSNPFGYGSNAVSITTKWETFDSGEGGLNSPASVPSSSKITDDWEKFD